MTAYLSFSIGTESERVPCGSVVTIGRDKTNHIVLGDLQVSRDHAIVRRLGESDYYLIDSGSSNGSRVNQNRITSPTLLTDGDRITIGITEFLFEQAPRSVTLPDTLSFQATMVVHSPLIKEITILVADIRGFTRMSEQLPIEVLTRVMNHWFTNVSETIQEYSGIIDKFIGDCVFARWESDNSRDNVIRAIRTSCVISRITSELSKEFPEISDPLKIGAGIHTGIASLGIGSDNTALGDSVNTAFRMETASKELGTDIVLSEAAFSQLPDHHWHDAQQQLKLKGKKKPVNVVGLNFEFAENLLVSLTEPSK